MDKFEDGRVLWLEAYIILSFQLICKYFLLNVFIQVFKYSKFSNVSYFQFRKDFDIERSKETEDFEESSSLTGSSMKNCSNSEAK